VVRYTNRQIEFAKQKNLNGHGATSKPTAASMSLIAGKESNGVKRRTRRATKRELVHLNRKICPEGGNFAPSLATIAAEGSLKRGFRFLKVKKPVCPYSRNCKLTAAAMDEF